jgi:sporulation protein YlmC with PRC-barrel domain
MNTCGRRAWTHVALAAVFAILVLPGASPLARAQSVGPPNAARAEKQAAVRVIAADASGGNISSFIGQSVRDADGRELGTVKDLVLDVYAGRIVYAATTGRSGDAMRLVPFAALQREQDGFAVGIGQSQWEQVPPLTEQNVENGRITLSEAERRLVAERFGQEEPAPPNAPPHRSQESAVKSVPTLSGGSQLLSLGDLRGKAVSTGSEDVGTITDVSVDPEQLTAAAVIAPEADFAAGNHRFLVPLHQLNLASRDQDPITTKLTRSDFEKAQRR